MAYRVALSLFLSNLHDVFHVSQLRKYIHDLSHVIQVDYVQVRENLTFEASPFRVEDREVKHPLDYVNWSEEMVNVVWGGLVGGSMTWELESQMMESYPTLFPSDNFLGQKFYK